MDKLLPHGYIFIWVEKEFIQEVIFFFIFFIKNFLKILYLIDCTINETMEFHLC